LGTIGTSANLLWSIILGEASSGLPPPPPVLAADGVFLAPTSAGSLAAYVVSPGNLSAFGGPVPASKEGDTQWELFNARAILWPSFVFLVCLLAVLLLFFHYVRVFSRRDHQPPPCNEPPAILSMPPLQESEMSKTLRSIRQASAKTREELTLDVTAVTPAGSASLVGGLRTPSRFPAPPTKSTLPKPLHQGRSLWGFTLAEKLCISFCCPFRDKDRNKTHVAAPYPVPTLSPPPPPTPKDAFNSMLSRSLFSSATDSGSQTSSPAGIALPGDPAMDTATCNPPQSSSSDFREKLWKDGVNGVFFDKGEGLRRGADKNTAVRAEKNRKKSTFKRDTTPASPNSSLMTAPIPPKQTVKISTPVGGESLGKRRTTFDSVKPQPLPSFVSLNPMVSAQS